MRLMPYSVFLLIVVFLSISACNKSSNKTETNDFSLQNYSGSAPLNVDIYPSEEDFINGTNLIIHALVNSNSTYTFPSAKLKAGNWYYVDVYNNDYTYTNWVDADLISIGEDSSTLRRFKYGGNNKIFVVSGMQSNARNVLIKGTQASSRWKAIDAIDLVDGSGIWFTLSPQQRYQELVFSKNSTAVHLYLSGSDTGTRSFSFKESGISGYPTFIINPYPTSLHIAITNTYKNIVVSPDDQPPTKDSILALLNGNLYILARQ